MKKGSEEATARAVDNGSTLQSTWGGQRWTDPLHQRLSTSVLRTLYLPGSCVVFPINPGRLPRLKTLLKDKKRIFNSGTQVELRWVQKELQLEFRQDKDIYRRKLEEQLGQNTKDVWRGLKKMVGRLTKRGREWANKQNLIFNRFDSTSTSSHLSTPPISLFLYTSHSHQPTLTHAVPQSPIIPHLPLSLQSPPPSP